jgi:hypothetical protein
MYSPNLPWIDAWASADGSYALLQLGFRQLTYENWLESPRLVRGCMSDMSNNPNLLNLRRVLWLYNCIYMFYITVYHNNSTLELVVIQKDGVERQILAGQCSKDS